MCNFLNHIKYCTKSIDLLSTTKQRLPKGYGNLTEKLIESGTTQKSSLKTQKGICVLLNISCFSLGDHIYYGTPQILHGNS